MSGTGDENTTPAGVDLSEQEDTPVAYLPVEQDEPHTIRNGTSTTTFHSRGVTIKGPPVDDATENQRDYGARMTIHSSHGARNSAYGEGLRMVVDTPQSKNMIAWYDGFSSPGRIKAKAWIGYHHGTYPDIVHDHISIETPNEDGALYTRFGISTKRSAVTNVDFNMSDVQHTASQGGSFRLAVGGWRQTTYPRDLIFATGIDHAPESRRWAVRADTAREAGNNTGSAFRLVRFSDKGEELSDKTLAVTRSNGHIGAGSNPHISWRVNVESDVAGLRLATTAPSTKGLLRLETPSTTAIAISVRKPADVQDRFSVNTMGRIEWGDGSNESDTNLRRTTVREKPVLGTNADMFFDTAGKGPILRSPGGNLYRILVTDRGKLQTEKV